MKRRTVIRAAGSSLAVVFAGCLGGGEDGTDSGGDASDDDGSGESTDDGTGEPTSDTGSDSLPSGEGTWRTFQGDAANTGTGQGTATGPGSDPSVAWTLTADDEMQGPPVIVDDTVLATSWDDTLYAASLSSGDQLWTATVGSSSAPVAVGDGTVYVAGNDLVALNLDSGERHWTAPVNTDGRSGPVLADGMVYVGAKERLVALSAESGERQWTVRTAGPVASTPHVTDDTVYFTSTDGNIYAASTDGELRWQERISGSGGFPSPTVLDGVVYFGWGDGGLYALDAADGATRWEGRVGGREVVAVADGTLYNAGYPLRAMNLETQEMRWTTEEPEGITTNFTVGTDRVYLGTWEGNVFGYDRETGAQVWRHQDNYEVASSVAIADGRLVYGNEFGDLVCLS